MLYLLSSLTVFCIPSSPDNYCRSLSPQPLKALCNISLSSLAKMSLQISVMLILLAPCFWPEVEYIALLEQMESGLHREAEIAWPPARSAALAAAAGAARPGRERRERGQRGPGPLSALGGRAWGTGSRRLYLLWIKICLRLLVSGCSVLWGDEPFHASGSLSNLHFFKWEVLNATYGKRSCELLITFLMDADWVIRTNQYIGPIAFSESNILIYLCFWFVVLLNVELPKYFNTQMKIISLKYLPLYVPWSSHSPKK